MMNPNPGIGPGMQQNPNMLQSPQMVNPQQQQQQQQPQPGLAHPVEKADSITKAKNLIGPLRDSLSSTLKAASQTLHHNNLTDVGTIKSIDQPPPRFDKLLEDFYSISDQIELHLKTALQCYEQHKSSQHYLGLQVATTRLDPITEGNVLSYPQYLGTVKSQISYAKEIQDTLHFATQNIMNMN